MDKNILARNICKLFEFFLLSLACQQIDQWPTPEPGVLLQLPLLGELLQCRLPSSRDVPQRQLSSSKANGYHKKVIGHGQQVCWPLRNTVVSRISEIRHIDENK